MRRRALFVAAVLATLATARLAAAGGVYFSDRGVRPMGRAGAFVAGADDLSATWYNPAGLTEAGTSLLLDAAWLDVHTSYDQAYAVTSADGVKTVIDQPTSGYSPHTTGSTDFFPSPTFAFSKTLGNEKRFTIAAGMYIPYIALLTYPETTDGKPSPGRYALGSFLSGTIGAQPSVWGAYRVTPQLSIGVGFQLLIASVQTTVRVSLCPQDRLSCAPEQPEYDVTARAQVGTFAAPSGNLGIMYAPLPWLRLGASTQLPMLIDSPVTFKARLPDNALFDSAQLDGSSAHIRIMLPAILRLGVEGRYRTLRVEATWVREFWSMHKSVELIADDIRISGLKGGPSTVTIPNVSVPRNFIDSDSIRLGGEGTFHVWKWDVMLRAGVSFETSAVPRANVSLLSLDFDKVVVSIGGSIYATPKLRLDAVFAHTFAMTTTVDPYEAQVGHINPFPGNAPPEPTNGGTYAASANLLGVGLNYRF
jgi:long-chain fatty acid transport protein